MSSPMDDIPDLSDVEAAVLQTVHAEGNADLYALARAVGTGPRTVQEAIQRLSDETLVFVTEKGVQVHCTPAGEEVAQTLQNRQ